jgi:anti-anti-sigma factor
LPYPPDLADDAVFHVRARCERTCVRLCLVGELDIATTPTLIHAVGALLAQTPSGQWIRLDLADLDFVDVHGLNALAQVAELVSDHHGRVSVARARPFTCRLLHLMGVIDVLPLEPRDAPEPDGTCTIVL